MRYVFHPEAIAEYSQAVQYYAERRTELAQAFINAVEDAVIELENLPLVGAYLMKMFGDA